MRIKKWLCLWLGLCFLCLTAFSGEVKYVFLFIGDGMSIPQRMLAEEFLAKTEKKQLAINHFPYQALTRTHSANSLITDSAASGTAIACGEKTNNGRIGVASDGKTRLQSVAEVAKLAGKKVGIVSCVTINHATPASFYGHQSGRGNAYDLGLDLIASGFDYFGGGGLDAPDDKKSSNYQGNIYELAAKKGYKVVADAGQFKALTKAELPIWARGADGALPYAIDGEDGKPTLVDFTRKGIELLDGDDGFFMMVEGGKIDWMCHANDAATVLRETIVFDEAVRVACEFAERHPGEVLIVVTGDHETGGLTLGFAGTGYSSYLERLAFQRCSRDEFQRKLKKAFLADPNLTFDGVKPLITENFGLLFPGDAKSPMSLTAAELQSLTDAFAKTVAKPGVVNENLTNVIVNIFDHKAGLGWTSGAHTALPVNTTASGKHADRFTGLIDNTDIAKKLKELVR